MPTIQPNRTSTSSAGPHLRAGVLLLAAAVVLVWVPRPAAAVPADQGRYIVVLHDGVADPRAVANEHARIHGAHVSAVHRFALKGYAATISANEVRRLAADRRVRSVEPDQPVRTFAQTTPTGVDRTAFPDAVGDSGTHLSIDGVDDRRVDADVAIIDTGVNAAHTDLNVVQTTDCTAGCVDGAGGSGPGVGHGTHVAGTAAALDNGFGVVGMAPGARVWSVKVLGEDGTGLVSSVVAGIDWVTARAGQIDVANMSLGCRCVSPALDTALSNSVAAGLTYTVAAGNEYSDASEFSPASHPDVITVSALADFDGASGGRAAPTCQPGTDDTAAWFTNFGPVVDVAAPGTCILATWKDGGYMTLSGTSMASPHVAGAAALLASDPAYRGRPADVREALLASGSDGWTDSSGDGVREPLLDVTEFSPVTIPGSVPPAISVGDVWVTEEDPGITTTATFTVSLSAAPAPGQTVSVRASTGGGSATAGSDYKALASTTIGFGPGETAKTVSVPVTGDAVAEGNETFVLNLSSPVGGVLADSKGSATVADDEGPLTVSVGDVWVTEGDPGTTATATFTVSLSAAPAPGQTVSVRAATANATATAGSDYTALASTTIGFGPGETAKTVSVPVTGDAVAEGNETFVLNLSSPVGGVLADTKAVATVVNDEGTTARAPRPAISVGDVWVTEGDPGTTATATFSVSLSAAPAPGQTVSVRAATANGTATAGSDYIALASTTIGFGPGETAKTVSVPVTGDAVAEGNETFVLNLSSPVGGVLADNKGSATVADEEGPITAFIGDPWLTEGGAGTTTTATFTVSLSAAPAPGQTVSVRAATANGTATAGSDYTALASTTIMFGAGETTKTVSVPVTGDDAVEGNETFVLSISAPVGGVLADPQGLATIVNDD